MRDQYEHKLEALNANLIEMGQMCSHAVTRAIQALTELNEDAAREVIDQEKSVNALENAISQQSILLILKETPVASDLRFVSAALHMNTDLERIGDQAEDISILVLEMLRRNHAIKEMHSLREMAAVTDHMINQAVQAFIRGDSDLAQETALLDDQVDTLFLAVRDELILDIRERTLDAGVMVDLLMIAKYLERIGDHAQNIAESVLFSLTGKSTKFD
ncbi:MAG: phosphate signaling complex protein PhoU [Peptoniphilaceae bacterium]|nr:phosphate signaling complex protein PhoU [Peptoniphilaceae bacterium]MDY3075430.1 phosphate signaling complex protein PhoU [Peptoniphilaceae bacterium]MDY4197084.1 phosphate signaling complex protein PhoU [Peptoniphilaceae bacterium]MDY5842031.1 phosphate signaling complex protein PhoU [Peptoniphilaceae bacterium]MDY6146875.1 phosphate signaling complex protein PhoU [Peptoniphilaceae bacterium]